MFSVFSLPILSTVPRSGTWFLRYAISFLCHLDRGGRIDDRLTGRTFGDPSGPSFDFQNFRGGPLFHVGGTLPDDHLFIGHTVCPGFAASDVDWWGSTPFHVPGYDYLHEGMNYRYTPIELAAGRYAPVRVPALERAARRGRSRPIVLVYRNPIDQAVSYFRYSQNHKEATYNSIKGRPLAAMALRDYLFESALPSYAKQFISFQALGERHPGQVRLVPYERLMARPVEVLAGILDHLSGAPRERPALADAVWLARREHMKAIEKEFGRSLDGTRIDRGSHISQVTPGRADPRIDEQTRSEAMAFLHRRGLDTGLFEWPSTTEAATAAASPTSPAQTGRAAHLPVVNHHLQALEAEAIHALREAAAVFRKPVILYSIGKDSSVLLHLAMKAFHPAKPPFALLHVDTTWKFREMIAFRDRRLKELGLPLAVHVNRDGLARGIGPLSHGAAVHTDIMKTEALKQALDLHGFDAAIGGARRDEEPSRAKERIFSLRSAGHRWDPRGQRPELWHLYNGRLNPGESIRVFPLSNWTELDIWTYIAREDIPVVPLYFATGRMVIERNGMLIVRDDERLALLPREIPELRWVRFRTLGCYPLTGAIDSRADTVAAIIDELSRSRTSERQGRAIDHGEASMERKKVEGYF